MPSVAGGLPYVIVPVAVNMPTVNSSESPGRIENSPHSAKMMNATPHNHQLPRRPMRTAGSNQEGSTSGVMARVMSGDTTPRVPFQPMSSLCDDGAVPPGDAPYEEFAQSVGVGPHPEPWPDDARYDPELLALGDRRNVLTRTATGPSRRSSPTSTRSADRCTWRSR